MRGGCSFQGGEIVRVRQLAQAIHQQASFIGVVAGKNLRPSHRATDTSRISTGTSTSGPITAANATGDASPKAAIATAMASSKLFEAAENASAVVRG